MIHSKQHALSKLAVCQVDASELSARIGESATIGSLDPERLRSLWLSASQLQRNLQAIMEAAREIEQRERDTLRI